PRVTRKRPPSMPRLRDLPIAVKLGAGFGAVIVLMAVIALVGLSKLGASNADTEYVATKTVPGVELIGKADTAAADYHSVELEHVLARTKGEKASLDGELKDAASTVDKAFAQLGSLD